MAPRLDLQNLLLGICDNVYFQPPEDIEMSYPCIVYARDWAQTFFATNRPYRVEKRYLLTIMDREADSPIVEAVAALPMCIFDRHFTVKDLNHDVYKLFF